MSTTLIGTQRQPKPARRFRTARQRRIRQARAFFIIAVLVTAISFAGHCLSGDQPSDPGQITTQSPTGR